ncbi:hypothetical protein ADM96_28730 [Burkholderia sp. ST111]|nr:hypothetical protein ADM96_28730 [Burkholderia sp. ST111]
MNVHYLRGFDFTFETFLYVISMNRHRESDKPCYVGAPELEPRTWLCARFFELLVVARPLRPVAMPAHMPAVI